MSRDEVYARLLSIFRDVLDSEDIVLKDEITANDIEGWDSISHISLIVAIEKDFKISLTTRDTKKMHNVGALVDMIAKKVAA